MAIKYKCLSYAERHMNPEYKKQYNTETTEIIQKVQKQEYNESLGKIITVVEERVQDNRSALSKFKVSDFALENLQQIGYDNLRPTSLSSGALNCVDSALNSLANIEASAQRKELNHTIENIETLTKSKN